MQLSAEQTTNAITKLKTKLKAFDPAVKVVVCPSFTNLPTASELVADSILHLGAQDIFWAERGPYTGEVSPLDLRQLGVGYVIIGHSERRQQLGETDTMVARKMISAVTHGMMPILCVGETAEERRTNRHEMVVTRQLQTAFRSLPPPPQHRRISIAYEPIWAIGTGEPADPVQANVMRHLIGQSLVDLYGEQLTASNFRLLYGGSVTADNITDYVNPDGFHGALVGTASLDPASFVTLLQRVKKIFS
jgi:triosephosphate isomerase